MADLRLLISYAHPDDESFGSGGLIARYVASGIDVYLICATDGDRGTIPQDMHGQYDSVRELRLAELACASEVLGLKRVYTLDYKDSGMMNTPDNDDVDCLWYQWQNNPHDVKRRIVDVIREVQPQVILTFNKYGGYGHPDHIAIQQATTQAFHLAADPAYTDSTLPPYQPQKLYYGGLPARLFKFSLWMMRLRGQDPRRVGVNKDIDFQAIIDHIEPVHARVNISQYLEIWDQASACHKSQGGGRISTLPMWARRILMRHQTFTRVEPPPANGIERDLFTDITPEPKRNTVS